MNSKQPAQPWVLQICHSHYGPFLDCARQYAALFHDTPYKVCTVFLTGASDEDVARGVASDEVIFLEQTSRQIRGLKLKALAELRTIAASRDFRLCIAHRVKSIYVGLLATRLPVIGVVHAFDTYARRSRRLFANLFRARLSLLGVSNAIRDDVRSCLKSWPAERIETLYNRIDVEAVQAELLPRGAARDALSLPQNAWIVGNVGRLHPDKDQATLIRGFALALPHLPSGSVLAIMGCGRLEDDLKRLTRQLGVEANVRFLGQVPNGRRYFKAFDVFALSSDHEPFGMVLLEAMAAEVPVIATDCGGAPEVLGDTGWLFPLHDAERLATFLVDLAGSQESRSIRALQRLHELFSDRAAKQHFFTLPMLQAIGETSRDT